MKLRRRLTSFAVAILAATGIVMIEASPAAASYPCPGGYSCYYDRDPYVYGNGANVWIAPSCGDWSLNSWSNRISYAANWGGYGATLWNWTGSSWQALVTIPIGTGSKSLVGTSADNRADRVTIPC